LSYYKKIQLVLVVYFILPNTDYRVIITNSYIKKRKKGQTLLQSLAVSSVQSDLF